MDGERIRPGQCLVSDAVIPIDYVVEHGISPKVKNSDTGTKSVPIGNTEAG